MIKMASANLSLSAGQLLSDLQDKIDSKAGFKEKTDEAQRQWNAKRSSNAKRQSFDEVVSKLEELTISEGLCNYCELNESNDIEHIYPKSFFPEHTFGWTNYLLACKQCNSGFKLDKCHVLDPAGHLVEVVRGNQPQFNDIAIINPRVEDPANFMILNLETFTFSPMPGLSIRDQNRFKSTIDILELNTLDVLIRGRRLAAMHYYDKMRNLVSILNCARKTQLRKLLNPYDDRFDFNKTLRELKEEIKANRRDYIQRYAHPSVWHAIKLVDSKLKDSWKQIFASIPEALNW